jgi:hypothetical protein
MTRPAGYRTPVRSGWMELGNHDPRGEPMHSPLYPFGILAGMLLLTAGACDDPTRVQACGLRTRDGLVTLRSTQGWPSRKLQVPEHQMIDSINTGRWVYRCD